MAKRKRRYGRRRYGRKGKGRKGSKAFPILLAAPVIPGFVTAWNNRGSGPVQAVRSGVGKVTGIDIMGEVPIQMDAAYKTLGLCIIGIVGHKIANKAGVNRIVKKATLGYLQL